MFLDVRGFTTLTEKSDPVVLLKQLNEYRQAMTDIIFRHDGIVDKSIGDLHHGALGRVHAGPPQRQAGARASLEMMEKLHAMNRTGKRAGVRRWTSESG